jgi:GTP-binding protein Era
MSAPARLPATPDPTRTGEGPDARLAPTGPSPAVHRAGFVALLGRPNAGKSTLLNWLVGARLAIVSPRPQTTRNRVTGILHRPDAQIVFVDTPGLHRGGGKLGAFMLETAQRAVEDVDVVCLVVDATDRTGPDELVLAPLAAYRGTTVCALNKIDLVAPRTALLPLIERWQQAHPFEAVVPIAAADGENCDRLRDVLIGSLPEHPPLFPAEATSDQPETFWVAEVVREQIFRFTHQEVPYASAVRVEELVEHSRPERLDIRATIFVEQESQKGIVIGKGGALLKRIGTAARQRLEAFFGVPVFLGLRVEVRRHWRKDDRALREFGFRRTS